MTDRTGLGLRGDRLTRHLTITALLLTLTALLLGMVFVFRTTGGTLFLFSTVAPLLVLVSICLFVVVTIREFRQAHRLFVVERYPPGQIVFRQGDEGDCVYFIREGEVEVIDGRRNVVLATLRAGEHFGEMALLTNAPRSATIRTRTEVRLAVVGKQNFLKMMQLLPAVEETIVGTVEERILRDQQRKQS